MSATAEQLKALAKRVRRGVQLLDRKIPNWRQVLRKHQDQFNFRDGDHCVLGTLEHHSGRMRVLAERKGITETHPYSRATKTMGIPYVSPAYGFDNSSIDDLPYAAEMDTLDALWRAEFEK